MQEIVLAAQIIDAKDTRLFPRGTRGQKDLYKGLLPEDIASRSARVCDAKLLYIIYSTIFLEMLKDPISWPYSISP